MLGTVTLAVARWEGTRDVRQMQEHLAHETDEEADEPERALA